LTEFWLDIGSGIDAEHWTATTTPAGVRLVALDPLFTSGMVASGRMAALPPAILRVGGEVRPAQSVESGKQLSFLPFGAGSFTRVHCGFMLHLYLETLELLAEECRRVLKPGGELEVVLPHFGDSHSEGVRLKTLEVLQRTFANAEASAFEGPFTTFWGDLYRDKSCRIRCVKTGSE